MDTAMIARVLWLRRVLRGRERWSRAQLEDHQQRQLARLRRHAASRSPFYGQVTKGSRTVP
jgi:phenylacetate-CoA ligase